MNPFWGEPGWEEREVGFEVGCRAKQEPQKDRVRCVTSHVYVCITARACSYEGTLKHLFDEIEKDKMRHRQAAAGAAEPVDGKARLEAATLRILSVLEENLETKGKLYKDLSQTQFFLMNNKHYIMRSIRK